MILNISDSINTILQCSMYVLIPNFCIDSINKKNKRDSIMAIILLWIIVQITTSILGNSSLSAIFLHAVLLIAGAIFFYKDCLGAAISFSIIQLCVVSNLLICRSIFFGYFQSKFAVNYMDIGIFIFLYVPQFIMTYLIFKNKSVISKVYTSIRSKNISIISLIIITVVADFVNSFNAMVHDVDNPIFKEIIFVLLGLFIIGITIYFANIEKKSKEIEMLNNALEEKVNELKKVKHDYGAQISYLYGMHLMEKYDRLGELLKDIINGHNNIIPEVKVSNDEGSIIDIIISGIEHKGINVIIDEQASLECVDMSEMELQRVISNVINNSVTAMKNKGIITIKTYYNFNNVVIKIQNNGPKIDDNIIERIFEVGFSTKKNKEKDHGFGLAIVKEIVESYRGSVSVKSDTALTEFIIKLPKVK